MKPISSCLSGPSCVVVTNRIRGLIDDSQAIMWLHSHRGWMCQLFTLNHIFPTANSSKRSKNMVFVRAVNSTDFIRCIITEASVFAQSQTYEKSLFLIGANHWGWVEHVHMIFWFYNSFIYNTSMKSMKQQLNNNPETEQVSVHVSLG